MNKILMVIASVVMLASCYKTDTMHDIEIKIQCDSCVVNSNLTDQTDTVYGYYYNRSIMEEGDFLSINACDIAGRNLRVNVWVYMDYENYPNQYYTYDPPFAASSGYPCASIYTQIPDHK